MSFDMCKCKLFLFGEKVEVFFCFSQIFFVLEKFTMTDPAVLGLLISDFGGQSAHRSTAGRPFRRNIPLFGNPATESPSFREKTCLFPS
jgi:hypothetical protein